MRWWKIGALRAMRVIRLQTYHQPRSASSPRRVMEDDAPPYAGE